MIKKWNNFNSFLEDVNLNVIDLKIIAMCFVKKYSVSEIQSEIDVAYKNLLPHLKKLEEKGFIIIKDNGPGKKKEIYANHESIGVNYFMFGMLSLWFPEEHLNKYPNIAESVALFLEDSKKYLGEDTT